MRDDVCPDCNLATLRIQRSATYFVDDDTPDKETKGFTVAVVKCVNTACKSYNKLMNGGAEPIDSSYKVAFCPNCEKLLYQESPEGREYAKGVEEITENGTIKVFCTCGTTV